MSNERADRASQETAERRRRDDLSGALRLKLAIPEQVRARLEAEGLTPRWVNDEGNRIADLTQRDDYDKVEGVEPVKVGTTEGGKPLFAYLLAKRTDFLSDDRRKADQRRRQVEESRFGGNGKTAQPNDGQMGAPTYVDPASKIGRANQLLD
jgi:hypothetical protein